MIFLMTGVPGASKTINTIKFINEDDQFADRPVFYHNIREFKRTNEKGVEIIRASWTKLDDEQGLKWFDLPKGSIVVFDECQHLFPVNTTRKGSPPDYLANFATHRHLGLDIFLITQEPRNIDSFVRRLVNVHRHHARHFGTTKLKIYEWHNRCSENVHDYHAKQEARLIQSTIPKAYFGVYHSAEVHTQKVRLPWFKLMMVIVPLLLIPVLLYLAYNSFFDQDQNTQLPVENPNNLPFIAAETHQPDVLSKQQYLDLHTPRIEGLPHTAPIYDDVREVKTYPWPSCVLWTKTNECRCISQQGTKMSVPQDICIDIVKNGMFDSARDPELISGEGRQFVAERSPQPTDTRQNKVKFIPQGDWLLPPASRQQHNSPSDIRDALKSSGNSSS